MTKLKIASAPEGDIFEDIVRINKKHRLLYDIDNKQKIVFVTRMWSHYE